MEMTVQNGQVMPFDNPLESLKHIANTNIKNEDFDRLWFWVCLQNAKLSISGMNVNKS